MQKSFVGLKQELATVQATVYPSSRGVAEDALHLAVGRLIAVWRVVPNLGIEVLELLARSVWYTALLQHLQPPSEST